MTSDSAEWSVSFKRACIVVFDLLTFWERKASLCLSGIGKGVLYTLSWLESGVNGMGWLGKEGTGVFSRDMIIGSTPSSAKRVSRFRSLHSGFIKRLKEWVKESISKEWRGLLLGGVR